MGGGGSNSQIFLRGIRSASAVVDKCRRTSVFFFIIMIIRLSVQGRQVRGVFEFAARLQQDGDRLYSLLYVGVFFVLGTTYGN